MDNLNKINGNKDLYDRVSSWMADYEDPTLIMESGGYKRLEVERLLYHRAFDIMYDISHTCVDPIYPPKVTGDDVEGTPV